jgi:hypothetical protein
MCKAKVISEKNIGFKKKLGLLALQDFFCNNKFANIYISSSELNVVTYNTRRLLHYALRFHEFFLIHCCGANEALTTTPPKPAGHPEIFAGGLSVTCIRLGH